MTVDDGRSGTSSGRLAERRAPRALLLALLLLGAGSARADANTGLTVLRNVPYAVRPGFDPALTSLDLYLPDGRSGLPTLIYVHGGGWSDGDKSAVATKPEACRDRGYAFVSVNYRLTPQAAFPAHAEDVAAAVAWVRAHAAEHGLDGDRLFLMGHSAGAHLVALVSTDGRYLAAHGLTPAALRAVVPLDTNAYDLPALAEASGGRLGGVYTATFGADPTGWAASSPITYVTPGRPTPPMLVPFSMGGNPPAVDPERARQAESFAKRLRSAGSVANSYPATEKSHEEVNREFGAPGDPIADAAFAFFSTFDAPYRWEESFRAGTKDPDGEPMSGTGVMHLEVHGGAVYAGTDFWGETTVEDRRPQVLRRPSASAPWELVGRLPEGFTRVDSLKSVSLERDGRGGPIAGGPVPLLLAGGNAWQSRLGGTLPATVFVMTPDGAFRSDVLGTYTGCRPQVSLRSLGVHRDAVTGADLVFAGASPYPPGLPCGVVEEDGVGVFRGVYDPTRESLLRWEPVPELQAARYGPEERILGFAEANGRLYCASSKKVFERTDGASPSWRLLADFAAETLGTTFPAEHLITEDIRAFRSIPSGTGEVLLFTWLTKMVRLDPRTGAWVVEADLLEELGKGTGLDFGYAQANESEDLPDGSAVIGLECVLRSSLDAVAGQPYETEFANAVYEHAGYYLVREEGSAGASYRAARVFDPLATMPEKLVRVRSVVVSPFPEEPGVLYAGGFAPRKTYYDEMARVSNTAWIYRGTPRAGGRRWVPVASHSSGAEGSAWRTDLALLNAGSSERSAAVTFHSAEGPVTRRLVVPPGAQLLLPDVVASLGATGSAPLSVFADSALDVSSRTFSSSTGCLPAGTVGLALPTLSDGEGLLAGASGLLAQLREDAAFRTNVTFVNTGALPATARLRLHDGSGAELAETDVSVPASGFLQLDRPFASLASRADLTSGWARVEVLEGGPLLAFATVIDNLTNDPLARFASPEAALPSASRIPMASHSSGAQGSSWRTDLGLLNPGSVPRSATVSVLAKPPVSRSFAVPPGSQLVLPDVVASLGASGSAPLRVDADGPLAVSSRTYSPAGSCPGSLGLALPTLAPSDGLADGASALLSQLREDAAFRTNVTFVNAGSLPASARLRLYDDFGSELGSTEVSVAVSGFLQLDRPFASLASRSDLASAWARVDVLSGGPFFVFATVIDNGTNDPLARLPVP